MKGIHKEVYVCTSPYCDKIRIYNTLEEAQSFISHKSQVWHIEEGLYIDRKFDETKINIRKERP